MNGIFSQQKKELVIPAFFFDKFWRSKYATKKYVENVIGSSIDFTGKKVLDFGCGTGSYSFLFDFDNYVGVDTDRARIKYAKKYYPSYNFHCIPEGDLEKLGNDFDYIFIVSTLHHLDDNKAKEYFHQFYKMLKPNGRIVGMEPCFFEKSSFNNSFMHWIDRGKHIRTERQYKLLFEDLFIFNIHKKFQRHFVYNEIFYTASQKL